MRALTVCQPYASLIIGWDGMPEEFQKQTENRTWEMSYRGPLLIHAGRSRKWLDSWPGPAPHDMPYGALLGIVDVVGCVRKNHDGFRARDLEAWPWLADHMHAEGPFCIIVGNPRRFAEPILYSGQQRVFHVPDKVIAGAAFF